ncbi:MAG: YfhO family protein [Lachnospiraceae bacterium]|nr:YfhO family protein [Lachnospiraceae bacterium]
MIKEKNHIIKNNLAVIVAFLTPIFILVCLYVAREIFPFGEEMYLRSDMYHQYAPFLKLFQTALKEGRGLEYTFSMGLGSDLVSAYAYYLASPLNWIVALFPAKWIPEIMSSFIILKAGLMSGTFTWYLTKKYHRKNNLMAACFGIFYALSGYMAAYSWNLMWLDDLVLLPLIIMGLERLVREGKVLLYTISLGLAVLSNYYIAIMICFFLIFYFIYLLVEEAGRNGWKNILKRIARFVGYSVIAGCMAAVVVLPAFLALFGTASAGSSFPSRISFYYSLLEMFAHGMMNAKVTMISEGYVPNIYAGIFTFALIPLFFLNKKIRVEQRIGKAVLMLILWLSFVMNVLAYIWHGFHLPNSLPARQSFIYIFLVLTICYETTLRIRQYEYWQILSAFAVAIGAVFVLQLLYDDKYTLAQAFISAGFLLCYLILFALQKRGLVKKNGTYLFGKTVSQILLFILLFAVCVAEASVNTNETGYSTTDRVNYTDDNEDIESILQTVDDGSFYRVEKAKRRTKNDGAWSDYRSASIFSSTTLKGLSKIYASFGMQSGTNSFSYYGNTPFTSALLGVKYKLSDSAMDDPLYTYLRGNNHVYLYEAKYVLPLGFMVKETTQAEVNPTGSDPFLVQNDLITAASGAGPVFEIKGRKTGKTIEIEVEKDTRKLVYVEDKLDNLKADIYRDGEIYLNKNYTATECKIIVDLGQLKEGDKIVLSTPDDDKTSLSVIEADLDMEAFEKAMNALSSNPWDLTEVSDGHLKGTVRAVRGRTMLFTTIPYEKGWTVYVDGAKAEYKGFYDAFIQIPLEEGEHEVEMIYHAPGLRVGAIISAVAIVAFVILCILKRKKQRKNP